MKSSLAHRAIFSMRQVFSIVIMISAALLFAACAPAATPEATQTPSPIPSLPLVTPQPVTPEPATLTIWLPDWMVQEESESYALLQTRILAFEEKRDVQVSVVAKLPRGPGGLLDWLQKAQPVAPSLLPDIIALPFQDVATAAQADLLQPLTPILSNNILGDLYPFAQEASMVDGEWMSLPFVVDFEHLAFLPAALSDPPATWEVILSSNAAYAFPYGGSESSWTDAILLHYLSAVPKGEDPARNREALRSLLAFYEAAFQQGLIDKAGAQTNNPKDTWERALQGATPMAETTASLWLAQQGEATFLRFGPTPTQDGQGRYLMHGWAYAIITADEKKQALASELLSSLMATETLADWSYQAHMLPARRTSLMQWPTNDFHRFASEALEQGVLLPPFAQDKEMARVVHQAVVAVLSGQLSAEEAWNQAVLGW